MENGSTPAGGAPAAGPDGRGIALNLALLALFLVAARQALELHLGSMFEDDAYFYFRIARNVAAGLGVTFDGLAPTNGFHVGWLAVLAPALALFQLALPHGWAVVLASALPVLPFALTLRPSWFAAVLAALALVGFGMEGVLAAALALGLAAAIDRGRPRLVAAAAAGLVAARVDAGLIPAVLAGWFLLRRQPRMAGALALGAALGAAVVVGANLWLAGTPFSVSSMQKAAEAQARSAMLVDTLAWNLRGSGNLLRLAIYATAVGWIVLHRRQRRGAGFAAHPVFLGAVFLFFATHLAVSLLRDWYFALPVLTALWAAGRIRVAAGAGALAVPGLLAVLPAAAALWFQLAHLEAARQHRADLEAAGRALPAAAPVYAYDASGFAGHVLWPRPVLNGDALVNTAEYARNHRDPDWLFGYFARTGTRHVLSDFAETSCIMPGLCCRPEAVETVVRFAPSPWYPAKALWAFREGHACPLQE